MKTTSIRALAFFCLLASLLLPTHHGREIPRVGDQTTELKSAAAATTTAGEEGSKIVIPYCRQTKCKAYICFCCLPIPEEKCYYDQSQCFANCQQPKIHG